MMGRVTHCGGGAMTTGQVMFVMNGGSHIIHIVNNEMSFPSVLVFPIK